MDRGTGPSRHRRRNRAARPAPPLRLIAGVLIPVTTYVVLTKTLHDDLAALAITEAIPVTAMLAVGLRRRRLDPIAMVAAIVLLTALVVSIAAGGSVLPLKLRRAVVTGSLGLACLVSVLVRRPLLPIAMSWLARVWPLTERLIRGAAGHARQQPIVLTAIIGVTLLLDACAQVTLALRVSTTAFLGASRLARTAVFAVGLATCVLYMRWVSGRPRAAEDVSEGAEADRGRDMPEPEGLRVQLEQ